MLYALGRQSCEGPQPAGSGPARGAVHATGKCSSPYGTSGGLPHARTTAGAQLEL